MQTLSNEFLHELGRRNLAAMTAPENWPQQCAQRKRHAEHIAATRPRYRTSHGWSEYSV
jgi:hypothetical protein